MTSSYGGSHGGSQGGSQGGTRAAPGGYPSGYRRLPERLPGRLPRRLSGRLLERHRVAGLGSGLPAPDGRPADLGLPAGRAAAVRRSAGAAREALARAGRRGRGALARTGRRARGDRQRGRPLDGRHGRRERLDRHVRRIEWFGWLSGSGGSGGSNTVPTQPVPGNGNIQIPPAGSSGRSGSSAKASSAQQVGVVDIYTQQKYNSAAAAGTGMVLTSSGDVLTNNHVIEGSTSITVRIVATGKSYTAKVVGTAPSKDVALLHLVNASGLTTANLGDSGTVSVGDAVTGVGNAGGVGGTPSAASGKVTALHRAITASDESGSNAERLEEHHRDQRADPVRRLRRPVVRLVGTRGRHGHRGEHQRTARRVRDPDQRRRGSSPGRSRRASRPVRSTSATRASSGSRSRRRTAPVLSWKAC